VSRTREPIFNIPTVVVVVLALLALIHAVRVYILPSATDQYLVCALAFIPARYAGHEPLAVCGGYASAIWTFVTYSLIHADITHIGFNAVWLAAFGSAVARRFGTQRILLFFALSAVGGALAHLVSHIGDPQPMIGASGAISGTMGAAARFAFQRNGPLDSWRADRDGAYGIAAPPLFVALRNPRVLGFVGAWFALNLLFGLGAWSIIGEDQSVAWEAHVGGFLTGLLLFPLFDPVQPADGSGEGVTEPSVH
jgi:membrane associated rhomboid family serine protease